MSTTTNPITAEQLWEMGDCQYELVRGELVTMSPAGPLHGQIAGEVFQQLAVHCKAHKLNRPYIAETGFILARSPDTVRCPDAAYVASERLPKTGDHNRFLQLAPDFVAEVRSPRDSAPAMERKANEWLDAGSRVVLTIDPTIEAIRRYQSTGEIDTFAKGEAIDCSAAVPGWTLDTSELFEG